MTKDTNPPKDSRKDFQIESSDYRCVACETDVAPGSRYVSSVVYRDEQFARRNHCDSCWEQETAEGTSGAFAFWRTARPPERRANAPLMRFEPTLVFGFFEKLQEDVLAGYQAVSADAGGAAHGAAAATATTTRSHRQKRDLCFVLSLLLIRKKVLTFGSSALVDGREWLQLSARTNPEQTFWVENPDLSDEELERVRDDIGELLHMRI